MRAKRVHTKVEKYTLVDFQFEFADEKACLDYVWRMRFPNGPTCEKCQRVNQFHLLTTRKVYVCNCGHHVSPTAGTIFHKSRTPLKTWLYCMYLMANSKNGMAALELQRYIGGQYKTAWRICKQIHALMGEELPPFKGTVEVDEAYIGGEAKNMHKAQREERIKGRGPVGKAIVVAALEREGIVAPFVVEHANAETAENLLAVTTDPAAKIVTDEYGAYHGLKAQGYDHESVCHGKGEYVKGDVHTNGIEGFWSQMETLN